MIVTLLNGRSRNVSVGEYQLDWDGPRKVSKVQRAVEEFLRPYWTGKMVLGEWRIPGTKLRLDLVNVSDGLLVEVDGDQHASYNPHFHGSLSGYRASIKRDLQKDRFAELNGWTLVRITEADVKNGALSAQWFMDTYNVTL